MGKSFRLRKTGNRPAFGSGGHRLTRTENNAAVKKDEEFCTHRDRTTHMTPG